MINWTGRGLGLLAVPFADLWPLENWLPPGEDGTGSFWEVIAVPQPSSLLVTVLIPLGSKCVRQSLLGSGGVFLREENRKTI